MPMGFERAVQVCRRLLRAPLFTTITLLTLAVGVGANTVIFSVLDGVLLKPLPYAHPDELIGVWYAGPGIDEPELEMAPFLYFIARDQNTTLADIGLYADYPLSITGVGQPEHVAGLEVTDGVLPMLGVKPALGRLFTRADDTPGAPQTVLISNAYWHLRFGGDPGAVGRILQVNDRPRQIIGVLPPGFRFANGQDVKIYLPSQLDRSTTYLGDFTKYSIARMKPGVTIEQASADLERLLPIALRSFPAPPGTSAGILDSARLQTNLRPLKKDVVGNIGEALWILMGSIAMVLLIACANVANLLLVRVEGRRQELAIRSALGAGWRRIAADLLLESTMLGMTGSLLGLGLAEGALHVLLALAPASLPRMSEIGINLPVLLFTLAVALFTSLLIGSIPVFKFAGAGINSALREGGRSQSQSRDRHRVRSILVIVQVALALILLICSGLMIHTFSALLRVSPGFTDPATIESFSIYISSHRVPETDRTALLRLQQAISNRIATLPGVTSAALCSSIPLDDVAASDTVYNEDRSYAADKLPPLRLYKYISPGFLATMGTPVIAGRDYTWDDNYNLALYAIVSENFARESWGSPQAALGKRIRSKTGDPWRQIIGVVADVHEDGVHKVAPTTVYWPMLVGQFQGQPFWVARTATIVVRSPLAGSQSFDNELQQAVWSIDGDLSLADMRTLGELYGKSMARTSFTLVMLAVAASMALLLGVIGIYGVISYSVSQRTREIGIRMALGAQREAITQMFVRHGLILTGIGIAFGLVGAFLAARLMGSLLFNVSPADPVTFIAVPLVIAGITWLACYLPARRAATVDPADALRSQ